MRHNLQHFGALLCSDNSEPFPVVVNYDKRKRLKALETKREEALAFIERIRGCTLSLVT